MTEPLAGGVFPPEVADYVDLKIYDRSDAAIAATMRAAAQFYLPGWQPHEGNPEMMLAELFALAQAEQIMAINRVPGAVVETVLQMAGLSRDLGVAPTARVAIEFSDTLGHVVPAGVRLYLRTQTGEVITFLVEDPGAEALRGASTAIASVIGDTFTSAANGAPVGSLLTTADPLSFVDRVRLITPAADGRNPETGREFLDRGVARLARLSDTLVVPRQFAAAAQERPEVERALAIDNFDPGAGPYVLRANLVADPSFETDASALTVASTRAGVTVTEPAVSSSGTAGDGTRFAFVNVRGASGGGADVLDATLTLAPVPVTGGAEYRIGFAALSPGTAYWVAAGARWLGADGKPVPDEHTLTGPLTPVTINGYRDLGVFARAPRDARSVALRVLIANASANSTTPLRLDRLVVERADTWTGTWTAGTETVPGPNSQDDPGHLTVAVLGDGPALLSAAARARITADLSARAVANLVVHVVDVDLRPVPVWTRIAIRPGYVFAEVAESVAVSVRSYLDPLSWTYGPVVRHNEMVSLIDGVEGVDYVDEVWLRNGETTGGTSAYTTGNLTLDGLTALPIFSRDLGAPSPGRGIIVEPVAP